MSSESYLLCFPYAGSGASVFRRWRRCFPHHELLAVELPGRETRFRESSYEELECLINDLAEALYPYVRDSKVAIFGHSMGALLGYEFARLTRHSLVMTHLFVSACRSPEKFNSDPPISHLPDREFVEELSELGGIPEAVLSNRELLDIVLPALRSDLRMCESYVFRPSESLNCPITAFVGLQDPEVGRADVASWSTQTSGQFAIKEFEGGHFFIRSAETELLNSIYRRLYL